MSERERERKGRGTAIKEIPKYLKGRWLARGMESFISRSLVEILPAFVTQ